MCTIAHQPNPNQSIHTNTNTNDSASIEELRLQRHLLRTLLAEQVATKDPRDVESA
jgi:hypothetical protein